MLSFILGFLTFVTVWRDFGRFRIGMWGFRDFSHLDII